MKNSTLSSFVVLFVMLSVFEVSKAQNKLAATIDLQGMGPSSIATTANGEFIYVGFFLSETVFKVRSNDLQIMSVADLSEYFPSQSYHIVLDATEQKLFVHCASWRKLLVLDTQTMSVVKSIENIDAQGMLRSVHGPYLLIWNGNVVKYINTNTLEVTDFVDARIGFLQIQESKTDSSKWYVATVEGPDAQWKVGLYNNTSKTWVQSIYIQRKGATPCIMDMKISPGEQKLYVAIIGGNYAEYHSYGWVYAIDLIRATLEKEVSVDGGVWSLAVRPDGQQMYLGTHMPIPNTNNILAYDCTADTIIGAFRLGKSRYHTGYIGVMNVKCDPIDPRIVYATSIDANALVKLNSSNLELMKVLLFNEASYLPQFFVENPMKSNGYVLGIQSPSAYVLNLDKCALDGTVRFPGIRTDAYRYDIARYKNNRLLIAQGESVLEVNESDMSLIESHRLPSDISGFWSFMLSRDQTMMYSVWNNPASGKYFPDTFLAVNTSDFKVKTRFGLSGGAFTQKPFELPDRPKLYVLGGWDNGPVTIHSIRTTDLTIQKTITFQDSTILEGIAAGPFFPFAYDSSTGTLYTGTANVVLAIDTYSDVIKKVIYLRDLPVAIGLKPQQLVYVNPNGLVLQPQEQYLYMAHYDRSFMSIYDIKNEKFLPRLISLKGFGPSYAFANKDVSKIFCLNSLSNNISVIDVKSKSVEKIIDLHTDVNTGVTGKAEVVGKWLLGQNYPNPFNPSTTIRYSLSMNCRVILRLYDMLGREVRLLKDEYLPAGEYSVTIDATQLTSGIYFYRLQAGEFVETKKMILLR